MALAAAAARGGPTLQAAVQLLLEIAASFLLRPGHYSISAVRGMAEQRSRRDDDELLQSAAIIANNDDVSFGLDGERDSRRVAFVLESATRREGWQCY